MGGGMAADGSQFICQSLFCGCGLGHSDSDRFSDYRWVGSYCLSNGPGPASLGIFKRRTHRITKSGVANATRNHTNHRDGRHHGDYCFVSIMGIRFPLYVGHWMVNRTTGLIVTEQKQQSGTTEKRWYVIHAYSGFENNVVRALREKIKIQGLEDYFGEIIVPTEDVVEMRGGQKRRTARKFFPGYILVQMVMNDTTWHLVRNVPRVLGFIGGTAERPAPITDREANNILQRVEEGETKPKPKVLFEPGEVVRVTEGPFADFNGVVEDVNYEKNRLRVAVLIFGRSTPVELEFGQVEKS